MGKILVLGAGVMGTTLCVPLAESGNTIHLVGTHLDGELIKTIQNNREHPKLKIKLPSKVIPFYHHQLNEALTEDIDLIVMGVSSKGVDWAIQKLGPMLKKPVPVLMLTKGLAVHNQEIKIMPDIVQKGLGEYGFKALSVGGVGGPCIAAELAVKRDTSVIFSFFDPAQLKQVLKFFRAPYYHVRSTVDLVGLEVCAALKNFYALAVGSSSGLLKKEGKTANGALMYNLSSGIFTQALLEISLLVDFMGGNAINVYGLAGTGDLYVTCQAGRNSRMGNLLGLGIPYTQAKEKYMPDDTVEGADLALTIGPSIEALFEQGKLEKIKFPLASEIINTVCHDRIMKIPWEKFYRY